MLTFCSTCRKDHEGLVKVPWHAVIVDEAHKLKNDASKTYQACERIPTKLRYGLTGTVMQVTDVMDMTGPNNIGTVASRTCMSWTSNTCISVRSC